ncbi:small RNA-binding protein 11, chloroplastic-like isoform X2 [Malania oleifera]|uniref:small RNA-binding protein 11, chloroplastic-like isoform X2 n=1 Tax=Malania oleifera TaxID=397392 RepID=UPI0025AE0728|nr:small RNA-binding protein 11, chloroplastic-like isoform X2 [Malania oleifera]
MAAIGGKFHQLPRRHSPLFPNISSPSHLLAYRGFASRLFVKGISFCTTEDTLAEAFSQFGKVVEVVMNKARNRSKGFGFVTFVSEDEAQKASTEMNGKLLDGRIISVENATSRRQFNGGISIGRGPPEPTANN